MKVVVVGAGALGSIVGAHLARAGEDVVFVARGERAATLRQRGIVLRGLADFTVPVAVATDPREVQTADVLLVTVKTYDTEPALASLRHLCVPSVLSLQNGVLKNEQLTSVFGRERVLGAAVVVAGELLDDGAVRFTLNDRFAVGELSGGVSDRARDLAAALVRAGLPAEASPHVQSVEWSKYVLFVGGMALASLTRLPTAKFLSDPDGALLMARVMRELEDVAARLQIPLDDAGPLPIKAVCSGTLAEAIEHVQRFGARLAQRAPAHKISTLQDLERGRRLEVEETLGYAVRKGAELGVPLPAIDTCYRLLSGVNRHIPDRKA
jgi:2-dehydropantoate 2-reductase